MNDKPLISVIMGIYNCADTLEEAVGCIINQTYENWELIMCDDGSTDDTYIVAQRLAEKNPKIIVIKNEKNFGLNVTLNNCLKVAKGEYIARMDGDDLCDPRRFEHQVAFLQSQTEYSIVSSKMYFFDEDGRWGENNPPEYPSAEQVVCGSPICHAPVMMKKKCMDAVNGYTEDVKMLRVEDVNLWIKLYYAGFKCYNIQIPLYGMRNDKNAVNRRKYKYRINSAYVRLKGCRMLHLPAKCYIKACTPLAIGLVPGVIRAKIVHVFKNGK